LEWELKLATLDDDVGEVEQVDLKGIYIFILNGYMENDETH